MAATVLFGHVRLAQMCLVQIVRIISASVQISLSYRRPRLNVAQPEAQVRPHIDAPYHNIQVPCIVPVLAALRVRSATSPSGVHVTFLDRPFSLAAARAFSVSLQLSEVLSNGFTEVRTQTKTQVVVPVIHVLSLQIFPKTFVSFVPITNPTAHSAPA